MPAPRPDCSERGVFGWCKRYRRLTKQGCSSKGASSERIFGFGSRSYRVYQVKDRLRCSIGQCPTEFDTMWTPQSDGKRERLCFIERKDNSFFRIATFFYEKTFLFFDLAKGETKTRGLFSIRPLFLSSLPLFLWSPSCSGEKSVAAFSLHSAFVPFPAPQVSAPSRMTPSHAGDAHPRLAHSASFHFFAFTHHAQPTDLLFIRCEYLCISTICSGG